jgi:hypothetical protein
MDQPATAVYDANILYPAPLRDLFMRLAEVGLVRARWTDAIHEEWTRNVLADNPRLSAERLARTRTLMNEAIRDCLVTGFEDLVASLSLPDPDDRHVLAVAIRLDAEVVVTYNIKDFPEDTLARFDIKAQHPDGEVRKCFGKQAGGRSTSSLCACTRPADDCFGGGHSSPLDTPCRRAFDRPSTAFASRASRPAGSAAARSARS